LIIGECESGKVRMWSRGCGPDAGRGRDAVTRGCVFEVGSLGRGGISEAASMGEQSWIFNACLRSFPFRKELGRPRMVVPTGAVV